MLPGRACDFYIDDLRSKEICFEDMTAVVKRRTTTAELERTLTRECNIQIQNRIVAENFQKSAGVLS